jgi:hypothetical protein
LLLRKGDVFPASDVPSAGYHLLAGGRSAEEPLLISAYGTLGAARPRIVTAGKEGLRLSGGGGSPASLAHIAVAGIEFLALPRQIATQNPAGIRIQMNAEDILLEDIKITHFAVGIVAQVTGGMIRALRIRRSVVADSYAGDGSHAQGIYCDEVDGLLIEENLIDHGGWTERAAGDAPDIFKHNIYIQGDARNVVVRGNIISNASSHGLQMRSGGLAENNLFVGNAIGLLLAGDGIARGNVFLDGKDISPSLPRRTALHVQNIGAEALIEENIIANSPPASSSKSISITPLDLGNGVYLGSRNVTLSRNRVFNWGGEALDVRDFAGVGAFFENLVVSQNDFQNEVDAQELVQHADASSVGQTSAGGNRYFSAQAPSGAWARVGQGVYSLNGYLALLGDATSTAQAPAYADPSRTLSSYHGSLGGAGSHDAFIAEALLQRRDYWRPAYTAGPVIDYVRAGFAEP